MIKSAEEYEYVVGEDVDAAHPHGDLDRIIIDGKIMPLRTGNTSNVDAAGNPIPCANILRGEDIAFLKEWANQRRFAVTGGGGIILTAERRWGCRKGRVIPLRSQSLIGLLTGTPLPLIQSLSVLPMTPRVSGAW